MDDDAVPDNILVDRTIEDGYRIISYKIHYMGTDTWSSVKDILLPVEASAFSSNSILSAWVDGRTIVFRFHDRVVGADMELNTNIWRVNIGQGLDGFLLLDIVLIPVLYWAMVLIICIAMD